MVWNKEEKHYKWNMHSDGLTYVKERLKSAAKFTFAILTCESYKQNTTHVEHFHQL